MNGSVNGTDEVERRLQAAPWPLSPEERDALRRALERALPGLLALEALPLDAVEPAVTFTPERR